MRPILSDNSFDLPLIVEIPSPLVGRVHFESAADDITCLCVSTSPTQWQEEYSGHQYHDLKMRVTRRLRSVLAASLLSNFLGCLLLVSSPVYFVRSYVRTSLTIPFPGRAAHCSYTLSIWTDPLIPLPIHRSLAISLSGAFGFFQAL